MDEVSTSAGQRLFISNRLEVLADQLAALLQTPLSSPLVPEVIVVQSKGMERWISMQLARKHGICANCRFPFPNAILHDLFRAVAATPVEEIPFEPELLTWRVMKLLRRCIDRQGFEDVRNYLNKDRNGIKLFQLAQRVSSTFDEYLIFRPNMILDWERGKESHWQAVLWRMLAEQKTGIHRAAIRERFFQSIDRLDRPGDHFPERICVFGISILPRFHMEVLERVGRLIPVYLFLLNPCREYWGDIVTHREARRIRRTYSNKGDSFNDLHLGGGNSLLASLGTLGRDFFDLVYAFDCEEVNLFEDISSNTLLEHIQADILALYDRKEEPDKRTAVRPLDDSLQINSCYSPMREVEVLHDCLLAMFDADSSLQPEHVLVMTPRIEEYTPFIQAVFDTSPSADLRIPYNVTDRTMRSTSRTTRNFLGMLELSRSRFPASAVIRLLEAEPVYTACGLTEQDLELIKYWIAEAGIRWGVDEATREQHTLPPYGEYTWRFGFQRLLLGYALPGREDQLFEGILPFDHIEGEGAVVMGKFLSFAEDLFAVATKLQEPRSLGDWSQMLTEILSRFFAASAEDEREVRELYRVVGDLAEKERVADFRNSVDLAVVTAHIRHQCEKKMVGSGFMSGGVTFCTLLPMRSIPFEVICLLGMNNVAYPRRSHPTSFDLIAQHPQRCDRSRRNDDRYLFLEALLSARKKLCISYVGQSLRDNSVIPPSVVVSELLDYVEAGFTAETGTITDHVVRKHPLQSFSPTYFREDGNLFSYSAENCRVAQRSLHQRTPPTPFISSQLSSPGEEWEVVEVEALCRFYSNPPKYLLTRRLGLYLEDDTSVTADREPFELKGLERYALEQRLLQKRLSGSHPRNDQVVARASGILPPGTVGACLFEKSNRAVNHFAVHVSRLVQGAMPEAVTIDCAIGRFRISGAINGVFPQGLISYRCSEMRPKDSLDVWIKHLLLAFTGRDGEHHQSHSLGLEKRQIVAYRFSSLLPERSEELLHDLLKLYWKGLTRPIHFFPVSSWEYADAVVNKEKREEEALMAAMRQWQGDDYRPGEREDLYYQQCFNKENPLDDSFKKIAVEVFGPLFEHREKMALAEGI